MTDNRLQSVKDNWSLPHYRLNNNTWERGAVWAEKDQHRTVTLYQKDAAGLFQPYGIGHY